MYNVAAFEETPNSGDRLQFRRLQENRLGFAFTSHLTFHSVFIRRMAKSARNQQPLPITSYNATEYVLFIYILRKDRFNANFCKFLRSYSLPES